MNETPNTIGVEEALQKILLGHYDKNIDLLTADIFTQGVEQGLTIWITKFYPNTTITIARTGNTTFRQELSERIANPDSQIEMKLLSLLFLKYEGRMDLMMWGLINDTSFIFSKLGYVINQQYQSLIST
jgi:hypothetical protein